MEVEEGCDLAAAAAMVEEWSEDEMMNLARDAANGLPSLLGAHATHHPIFVVYARTHARTV